MLRDWLVPISIIPMTFIAVALARSIIRHVTSAPHFRALRIVGPSSANLLFLVGLKLFIDTAPVHAKVEQWAEHAIYIIGVLVFLSIVRRLALLAVGWTATQSNGSLTLTQGFIPLIRNIITLMVTLVGGIMILRHFNYDVLSLITALGVGSLAVGLAAKDTLSNMISGFILIIDRNLKPGDQITLGDQSGEVEEIGLRSTRIQTGNGNTLIVPNSELVNTKILNRSLPTRAIACTTQLRLLYSVPFESVKAACDHVFKETHGIARERGASVMLTKLNELGQFVTITFWVDDLAQEGGVVSEFNERLMAHLRATGIQLLP